MPPLPPAPPPHLHPAPAPAPAPTCAPAPAPASAPAPAPAPTVRLHAQTHTFTHAHTAHPRLGHTRAPGSELLPLPPRHTGLVPGAGKCKAGRRRQAAGAPLCPPTFPRHTRPAHPVPHVRTLSLFPQRSTPPPDSDHSTHRHGSVGGGGILPVWAGWYRNGVLIRQGTTHGRARGLAAPPPPRTPPPPAPSLARPLPTFPPQAGTLCRHPLHQVHWRRLTWPLLRAPPSLHFRGRARPPERSSRRPCAALQVPQPAPTPHVISSRRWRRRRYPQKPPRAGVRRGAEPPPPSSMDGGLNNTTLNLHRPLPGHYARRGQSPVSARQLSNLRPPQRTALSNTPLLYPQLYS